MDEPQIWNNEEETYEEFVRRLVGDEGDYVVVESSEKKATDETDE